jgi:flavin reductase (DIM6/NTAB) family NADH-FMN oxidoreductase RutF
MAESVTDAAVLPAISSANFRSLMSTFPAGVVVVTSGGPDRQPFGMTCTALSSVSDNPATLLVCLHQSSRTLAALLRNSSFAVNLLREDARWVAELFASHSADDFNRVRWTCEPFFGGPHLVDHTHTIADCRVVKTLIVGEHTVVFGEVIDVTTTINRLPSPLLYGMRRYWTLGLEPSATTVTTNHIGREHD